jgi:hypothetical protein
VVRAATLSLRAHRVTREWRRAGYVHFLSPPLALRQSLVRNFHAFCAHQRFKTGRATTVQELKKNAGARKVSANFVAMAEKLDVTVPAAWPSGMAHIMQAYAACQSCGAQDAG